MRPLKEEDIEKGAILKKIATNRERPSLIITYIIRCDTDLVDGMTGIKNVFYGTILNCSNPRVIGRNELCEFPPRDIFFTSEWFVLDDVDILAELL